MEDLSKITLEDLKNKYEENPNIKIFFDTVEYGCRTLKNDHINLRLNNLPEAERYLLDKKVSLSVTEMGLGIAYDALTSSNKERDGINNLAAVVLNDGTMSDAIKHAKNVLTKISVASPSKALINMIDNQTSSELLRSFYNNNKGKLDGVLISSHIEQKMPTTLSKQEKKSKSAEFFISLDDSDFTNTEHIEKKFVSKLRAIKENIKSEPEKVVAFSRLGYK